MISMKGRPHAEERVRLATIALAEIGAAPLYEFDNATRTVHWPVAVTSSHRKAIRLARLRLDGPDSVTVCDACMTFECGGVTVVDALLGRLCHRARCALNGKLRADARLA